MLLLSPAYLSASRISSAQACSRIAPEMVMVAMLGSGITGIEIKPLKISSSTTKKGIEVNQPHTNFLIFSSPGMIIPFSEVGCLAKYTMYCIASVKRHGADCRSTFRARAFRICNRRSSFIAFQVVYCPLDGILTLKLEFMVGM